MMIALALVRAAQQLQQTSDSPQLDAEVLLAYALNKPKEFLFAHPETELTSEQKKNFLNYIAKRKNKYPVAYITKSKAFYGHTFFIDERVLIPRPETETIIDHLKASLESNTTTTIADIGTGSGCIAVTAAKLFPQASIIASDISQDALAVAQQNATTHKQTHITFVCGDLYRPFLQQNIKPTIIVANLPYLSLSNTYPDLLYEPNIALYAKNNGLALYETLCQQISQSHHTPDTIFFEIDPEQKKQLLTISNVYLPNYNYTTLPDLQGNDRYVQYSYLA